MTKKFNHDVMREFGCDVCIEISNVNKFIECLNRSMRHKGTFIGAFECVYTSRVVGPGQKPANHPAIIKSPDFKNQKEVRLIWEPKNKRPRPLTLDCRKAVKFCELKNFT